MTDEPQTPADDEPDDGSGRLGGILGRAGAATERFALRPARAVAGKGRDALTDEAERAIDGVMAGPLPEAVGRSLVEHRVVERVVSEALHAKAEEAGPSLDTAELQEAVRRALANPALREAISGAIESEQTKEFADQLVHSEAFRNSLKSVLSSDEVRQALMHQTTSFGGEIAAAMRTRAQRFDDALAVRHGQEPGRYGGLATRGIALVTDVLLAHVVFLLGGAMIGLVSGMIGTLRPQWVVGLIAGFGWLIVLVGYFVLFWSTAGQTPGMRIFKLRVLHGPEPPPVWRSLVRLVGLVLAIIPCFAGFVPVVFDSRKRALQDFMAGTVVVFDP
jgi:uncharacterized RDD family membrane protein YckC